LGRGGSLRPFITDQTDSLGKRAQESPGLSIKKRREKPAARQGGGRSLRKRGGGKKITEASIDGTERKQGEVHLALGAVRSKRECKKDLEQRKITRRCKTEHRGTSSAKGNGPCRRSSASVKQERKGGGHTRGGCQ